VRIDFGEELNGAIEKDMDGSSLPKHTIRFVAFANEWPPAQSQISTASKTRRDVLFEKVFMPRLCVS